MPVPVSSNIEFVRISAAFGHTCAMSKGRRVYCWGTNGQGQLGTGNLLDHFAPVSIASDLLFADVSAGDVFSCAVAKGGTGSCWGDNSHGQLGTGTTQSSLTPVPVAGGFKFAAISSAGPEGGGARYACGLLGDGQTWCWGMNVSGQLGNGTKIDANAPSPVSSP